MLINNDYDNSIVEFVSYTGHYPCLCDGVLTLKINGDIVRFGHESGNYDVKTEKYIDGNYDKFWETGGSCSVQHGISHGEWLIDVKQIPEQYRQYAPIIDEVFNENVEYGCCGGCI